MLPNPLLVFPHRRISGVDGLKNGEPFNRNSYKLLGSPICPAQAWLWEYQTDAHAVAYSIPNEAGNHPRINKRSLRDLIAMDLEPLLHWLIADIDNPNHAEWTNPGEDFNRLFRELTWTFPKGVMENQIGLYLTKRGYRLVCPISKPVRVSKAEKLLSGFILALHAHGISADETCIDWTRMFRAPFVVRDGVPQRYPARFPWITS